MLLSSVLNILEHYCCHLSDFQFTVRRVPYAVFRMSYLVRRIVMWNKRVKTASRLATATVNDVREISSCRIVIVIVEIVKIRRAT